MDEPDFRRTWKLIHDDGALAMLAPADYPEEDDASLRFAVRVFRQNHDNPLEKVQLVRLGLMAENYIDEVIRDDVPIPSV